MTQQKTEQYYNEVGDYFDLFAEKHLNKSVQNPVLTEMRNSFRDYVSVTNPKYILDIGCGPGEDVNFFAKKYPNAQVYGIDVSEKMIACAQDFVDRDGLSNVTLLNTGIEKLEEYLDEEVKFDVIYVFFGALNTVSSLHGAATIIQHLLKPGGQAILTFVNKYYLAEFFRNALKGRLKKAMARWDDVWEGYSAEVSLTSKTYTPAAIKDAFSNMQLVEKKGYSIFYPAWYQSEKIKGRPSYKSFLAKLDKIANNTPLWSNGEYTLFVYTHKN